MLVDTSVWSLVLHRKNRQNEPAALFLEEQILKDSSIYISGIIYQEILQGIKNEVHYLKVKRYLEDFDFLPANPEVHALAAKIFKQCRSKGISAHTVDCLIASLAIYYKRPLLTTDNDFKLIAHHTELSLIKL